MGTWTLFLAMLGGGGDEPVPLLVAVTNAGLYATANAGLSATANPSLSAVWSGE